MTDDADPRDTALSAAATGARVLVILREGGRLDGHIEKLLHGGFNMVAKVPGDRVQQTVWYADIDSMAEFVEDDDQDVEGPSDLDALSARLRAEGEAEGRKSLAERMIANSQREF